MQPQDAGSGFDWMHGVTGLGGGIIGTFLTWFWRVARMEPKIALDIAKAKDEVEARMEAVEQRVETKIEEEIGHFRDTLTALREKISDVEKHAVRREDIAEFRREYREDFVELRRNISEILGNHTARP